MELHQAQILAIEVIDILAPHCSRVQIAGSIRREKPFVHDIDLLCIPANQGRFLMALQTIGDKMREGPKVATRQYKGQQVDIYIATPETWWTLLLIRTGSKEHNVKLTTLAKAKGWVLHADGRGICDSQDRQVFKADSEEPFFAALGLPYKQPRERS